MTTIHEAIEKAVAVLKDGGVILYPTDTVWGLGCDATNEAAVRRVCEIKKRIGNKSLIVLADCVSNIEPYAARLTPQMRVALTECDIPQTVILPHVTGLASGVAAENGSVGFRIPNHPFCWPLVQAFGRPLVSTSANISGQPTARRFVEIPPDIAEAVDYVVSPKWAVGAAERPSRVILFDAENNLYVLRD